MTTGMYIKISLVYQCIIYAQTDKSKCLFILQFTFSARKHISYLEIPVLFIRKFPHHICQTITISVYLFRIQLRRVPGSNEEEAISINNKSAPEQSAVVRYQLL